MWAEVDKAKAESAHRNGAFRRKILPLALSVLVSGAILTIILNGIDWNALTDHLRYVRWKFVLITVAIHIASVATRSARWRILLRRRVAFWPTFHIYNVGLVVNNVVPFRAGELVRAYLIARHAPTISGWTALGTIAVERVLDMLTVVLIFGAILPLIAVENAVITGGLLLAVMSMVGFGALLFIASWPQKTQSLVDMITCKAPVLKRLGLNELAGKTIEGVHALSEWRSLLDTFFWTAISWFLSALAFIVLMYAFPDLTEYSGVAVALLLALVGVTFSIIVPFTVASVGPYEAAIIFALGTRDVPQELALAYAVVFHTVILLTLTGMGLASLTLLSQRIDT